ncbi:MAG TPA: Fic family protein [Asanoa sp.]|nr:Fic family protein [Asanoa sp.]
MDPRRANHELLFRDVYGWAGQARTVDISKPGVYFCNWRFVEDEVTAVLDRLKDDGFLAGVRIVEFTSSLAHYYGELNVRHPFREGNGRAIRAFLRQLGAAAGYRLDWSELSRDDNISACQDHYQTGNTAELVKVLQPVVRRL